MRVNELGDFCVREIDGNPAAQLRVYACKHGIELARVFIRMSVSWRAVGREEVERDIGGRGFRGAGGFDKRVPLFGRVVFVAVLDEQCEPFAGVLFTA